MLFGTVKTTTNVKEAKTPGTPSLIKPKELIHRLKSLDTYQKT
jgi:hypothetical protein